MGTPADCAKPPGRSGPFRHIRKAVKRFGRRMGIVQSTRPAARGYLICSSPRSGSTYLCELLASTGVLGVPREYLNVEGRWGRLDPKRPFDLMPLLERALKAGATPNGIYGLKAHADHFAAVAAVVDPLRSLPNLKFVSIRRRDILGQAISWARAMQTGQYQAADRLLRAPTYEAARIRAILRMLGAQQAAWNKLFAATACKAVHLEYESLMQNPQREIDRVAELMGVAAVPIVPRLVKSTIQRDDLSAAWRSRFLAETGDEFRHLADPAMPPSPTGSASAS